MKKQIIKVTKVHPGAKIPDNAYDGDVGWDLRSVKEVDIPGHSVRVVPSGLIFQFPKNLYGEIAERSGVSVKTPLSVKAGIIDPGYRGEVGIVLRNDSSDPFRVENGMKVAQMLIRRAVPVSLEEAEKIDNEETERGDKGFNSSGS